MMNGYEYTGMDAILAGSFRAAIYCRLSKDDDLDGESASIANQRDMLVAMNDGIDTMRDNNDIAPFKNILNEMYSKDISKKVHSSYLLKAQQGQFTGCVAPFGYRKDPEDKNHLLVDEETAPIVRQIFLWALEGHGPNFIRRRLEEQKVPCPTWWNRERGFRNVRSRRTGLWWRNGTSR